MGVNTTPVFIINDDFYDKSIDAQMLMAKIQLLDRGVIAKTDLRASLRKAGEVERTDEEIEAEAEDVSGIE